MIVDDLPTGSVLIFAFNIFTSFFFQFLGFVITYFLSTTHAARYGARAGLGLTFIQYGAYWRTAQNMEGNPSKADQQDMAWWNATMMDIGSSADFNATAPLDAMADQNGTDTGDIYYNNLGWGGRDWLALFFMTFGKGPSSHLPGLRNPLAIIMTETEPPSLYRLGLALHINRRLLASETMGNVHSGGFAASSTNDRQRPRPRSPGSKGHRVRIRV